MFLGIRLARRHHMVQQTRAQRDGLGASECKFPVILIGTRDNPDMSAAQYWCRFPHDIIKWHYSALAILVNVPPFDSELLKRYSDQVDRLMRR